jgi:hypothetical protein
MVTVDTSTLAGCFAADPGREVDLRAGASGDGTIPPVIRTGERGAR